MPFVTYILVCFLINSNIKQLEIYKMLSILIVHYNF
jgi:hypothetical protein